MKATLDGMTLRLKAEDAIEADWIRQMARKRLLATECSSVGAPPNWIELKPSNGWDYYEFQSAMRRLHAELVAAMSGIASFRDENHISQPIDEEAKERE